MKKILVIEDEATIRANVMELLEAEGYQPLGAEDGRSGIDTAIAEAPDLIVCDILLPDDIDGFRVLQTLRDHPRTVTTPFIFLTAKAHRDDVRLGMNLGADDYLTKPFTRVDLLEAIRTRFRRHETYTSARPKPSGGDGASGTQSEQASIVPVGVVVRDAVMQSVYEQAFRAARSGISVLLLGETGAGKEVLANEIHQRSPRADKPMVALNCAALSESLIESELFGHEKGAYTGAAHARAGLFESAHGGTVFLDEVGDLPMPTQVKLLRVIEDRKVMRVGSRTPVSINVRFISATHKDLEANVALGTFRQDLYFRLNGISFTIPALRERRSEIAQLAKLFTANAWRQQDRPGAPTISAQAMEHLLEYSWPGNIRELRNVMERAVVLCTGDVLLPAHLPPKLTLADAPASSQRRFDSDGPVSAKEQIRSEMQALERQAICDALERFGGNQGLAAEFLGVSRRTLVSRLATYDIRRPRKKPV